MKKLWLCILVGIVCIGIGFGIAKILQTSDPLEKELTFTVSVRVPGDYTIDMTPKDPTTGDIEILVAKGQLAVFTITNKVSGGFDVQIEYSVTGLPTGSYTFSKNPVLPNESCTLTVNTTGFVSNQSYVCTLSAWDYIPK
jgi:hypothetical protein